MAKLAVEKLAHQIVICLKDRNDRVLIRRADAPSFGNARGIDEADTPQILLAMHASGLEDTQRARDISGVNDDRLPEWPQRRLSRADSIFLAFSDFHEFRQRPGGNAF